MKPFIVAALFLPLAACQSLPSASQSASAQLQPTRGNSTSGDARFEQVGGKVRVVIDIQGLKPGGEHGLHIHEAGDCSSADGMSAKGHFNPFGMPHASAASAQRHAGDLPSLRADASGRARIDATLDAITVGSGPGNVVGRGLIVHADPDDFKTQPTGNSGARIACGVIRAG